MPGRTGRLALLGATLASWAWGCAAPPAPPALFSEQNARVVLAPLRFGWLSSERETGALPSAIALGGNTSGRVLLYLEFPELLAQRRLLLARLLLQPWGAPGAAVQVELSRVEAARGALRSWSEQPRALYPRVAARISPDGRPARLDVTEILRVPAKPGEPVRLMLRAEPGQGEAVLVATGAAGGAAPRLEIYWQ